MRPSPKGLAGRAPESEFQSAPGLRPLEQDAVSSSRKEIAEALMETDRLQIHFVHRRLIQEARLILVHQGGFLPEEASDWLYEMAEARE
jgi:hypothetical protein